MKIAHVIYDDVGNPWLGGGGAERARAVNRRLLERGAEITLICGNYPGPDPHLHEGIEVIRPGSSRSYLRSRLSFTRGAEAALKSLDYDLLVQDASAFHPVAAPGDVATVGIVHHVLGRQLLRKFPVVGLVPYRWERQIIGRFSDIIVVSTPVKEQVAADYNSTATIDVIPNGVEPDLLDSEPEESDTILFLGRLEIFQKGIDVLLEAFSGLAAARPAITLVIAGSGKDEAAVRARVEQKGLGDRVRFEGRVDGAAKTDCLRRCLFCVMPSRYEGWPVVAIEAGACAKAVIGTRINGFREAVLENETGLLAQPGDAASLAEAMKQLLDDRDLRHRLGAAGRRRAHDFTWDHVADRQWAVYQRVLGNG